LVKNITGAIISSVNPSKTKLLETAVKELFKITPRIVEAVTPHYNGKVGVDRYVICRAAASKYSPPLIVFDFGTATTINVIDANGHFIGGSILAGMMTGVNALASSTALLPKIELSSNAPLIGRNTEECISSGAVFGNASLLDGMVSRIEPNATVVVTGGNAEYVIPFCKTEVIHEPDLLLKGLVLLESDT
jgi:type III pantothenate kinase